MTRLAGCQLIVAEGGRGTERTAGGRALCLSYRLAGRARRWGLVTQCLTLTELGVPVVRPDMDAARFRRGWRRLPVLVRLWAWVLVPAFGMGLLVSGSREFLARRLGSQEDLPTREEELGYGRFDAFQELLVEDRDALLVRALEAIHQQWSQEPISVAVVYGAGHMPGGRPLPRALRLPRQQCRMADRIRVLIRMIGRTSVAAAVLLLENRPMTKLWML